MPEKSQISRWMISSSTFVSDWFKNPIWPLYTPNPLDKSQVELPKLTGIRTPKNIGVFTAKNSTQNHNLGTVEKWNNRLTEKTLNSRWMVSSSTFVLDLFNIPIWPLHTSNRLDKSEMELPKLSGVRTPKNIGVFTAKKSTQNSNLGIVEKCNNRMPEKSQISRWMVSSSTFGSHWFKNQI